MLPTVLVSSVIRSSHQGDSHGGIYRVNLETGEYYQILDWNNPDIDWSGRGGDRGVRGLAFFGDLLYAVAGNELFAFKNCNGQLIRHASYSNKYLLGTHEAWRNAEKLYICAGGTDSIMTFDLISHQWINSFYHNKESSGMKIFDPNKEDGRDKITGGYMHLDSVYANDEFLWYCGAYTDGIWKLDLNNGQTVKIQLQIPDTHNARPYKSGYLYNLARYSKTIFEFGGRILRNWDTPKYDISMLEYTQIPNDHAIQGYTRGLAVYGKYVITGTSPATVNVFDITSTNNLPIKSIQLSNDMRNSICGITLYEWEQ